MINASLIVMDILWFMAPVYIGNISPLFVRFLPFETPVDFGYSVHGIRVFGDHKTWRGLGIGIAVGTIISLPQGRPYSHGLILTSGNFIGDLLGACIKRRINIPPGGKSVLIDSIPSPFIALFFAWIAGFLTLSTYQSIIVLITIPIFHLVFNFVWFLLKLKDVPW